MCDTYTHASPTTGKKTWWGCGSHVPMVMDPIPKDEWCECAPKTEKGGNEYPPVGSHLTTLWLRCGALTGLPPITSLRTTNSRNQYEMR